MYVYNMYLCLCICIKLPSQTNISIYLYLHLATNLKTKENNKRSLQYKNLTKHNVR